MPFQWTYVAGLVGELVEHVSLEAPQDKGREEPAKLEQARLVVLVAAPADEREERLQ